MEIKTKTNKCNLIKLKNFLHSRGNHKQDEQMSLRLGENFCKWSNGQMINLQTIQTTYAAQCQKKKKKEKKKTSIKSGQKT